MRLGPRLERFVPSPPRGRFRGKSFPRFINSRLLASSLASAVAAFFIFGSETPFSLHGDNLWLTSPLLADAARQIGEGRLPFWTRTRWGGSPLLGDPVVGALYPGHLLGYLILTPSHDRALDVGTWLHVLPFSLGIAWWLASLGARRAARVMGILFFLTNASVVFMMRSWAQYWTAFTWWPWLFGACLRSSRNPEPRWILLAAVALAAQVYAGYPEFAAYSGTMAILVALASGRPQRPGRGTRLGVMAFVVALALCIAAPQAIPAFDMLNGSIRSGDSGQSMLEFSRQYVISVPMWLDVFSTKPITAITAHRVPPAIFLLALLGMTRPTRVARLLGAMAAASAVAASGLLSDVLFQTPGLRFFSTPVKWFYVFLFATLTLAGLGFDSAARASSLRCRRLVLLVASASTLLGAMYSLPDPRVVAGVAVCMAISWYRGASPSGLAVTLAIATATALWSASPVACPFPWGPGGFRHLEVAPLPQSFDGRPFELSLALNDPALTSGTAGSVGLNFGGTWGQPSLNGLGPLLQSRHQEILENMEPGASVAIAEQFGASPVILLTRRIAQEFLMQGYRGTLSKETGLYTLFPTWTRPRYELLRQAVPASREEAVASAKSGKGRWTAGALVEAPGPFLGDGDENGTIEVLESSAGRATLNVGVESETWMLVAEPYYRNWHARIDGHPTTVYPAAGLLSALRIPAGEHVVEMVYEEPGFWLGMGICIAALLLFAGLLIRRQIRVAYPPASGASR